MPTEMVVLASSQKNNKKYSLTIFVNLYILIDIKEILGSRMVRLNVGYFSFLFAPLLDIIGGSTEGSVVTAATEAVENAGAALGAADAPGGFGTIGTILIYGGFIAFVFFFMFWQPRKQQKAKQAMQDSLKIGDNVMTSSGFFGRIVDIEKDTFVIEFGDNKSIRIPVKKEAIEGIKDLKESKE